MAPTEDPDDSPTRRHCTCEALTERSLDSSSSDGTPQLICGSRPVSIPETLPCRKSTAIHADHTGSPPASTDEIKQRETRLGLATLTLARYCSNSVFGEGPKRRLNDYLPPISTAFYADHTGSHTDHTAFHDHKRPKRWGRAVGVAPGWLGRWCVVEANARWRSTAPPSRATTAVMRGVARGC